MSRRIHAYAVVLASGVLLASAACSSPHESDSSSKAATLATLLKSEESILRSTPPLRMDWEIRSGTTTRLQSAYEAQAVTEGSPLPESQTVNRTLYEEAVGHAP